MGSTINPDHSTARTHLKEEGWCVIPDVLSPEQTQDALSRLWQAKARAEQRGDDTYLPSLDPNESNVRVFYLLELDAIFRQLLAHPTAIEMVTSVLGEDFLISNFTANIARPGSQSMALHSDQSIIVPEPWHHVWAVNIIWCLTDVYEENGATRYIPHSNRWVRRADIPPHAPQLLRPFEAKAGSVIVMDGTVWHTSGANVTEDKDRALLFAYYSAGFLRQQVNWSGRLEGEFQRELSEELKRWLGLGDAANTRKTGDLRYMAVQYPESQES
ncbi:hypothetical protein FE257_009860 [Aspergillus nanangensis]|uniref:Phytanoyl-CoA dioxygenase family protein n=1 Tax=Aspergillus nanangensis TaxID=2582783 RepID=A0AAD4CWE1_ASPNN|nr:hypothetical protein FE257_009860 [Aspergillus nanangensis]